MESVHNPDRFMADLRQILSQGRKRIGLLLGAGAPLSVHVNAEERIDPDGQALIPGVEALTDRVIDGLASPESGNVAADVVKRIVKEGRNRWLQSERTEQQTEFIDTRTLNEISAQLVTIDATLGLIDVNTTP